MLQSSSRYSEQKAPRFSAGLFLFASVAAMDPETLAAYEREAAAFAADWLAQPTPTDLQSAVRTFFKPGLTADVGCGAGRDTAWLSRNGFPAIGYDSSEALLQEARRRYPGIEFHHACLPGLKEIADASFANVLCETVIMHLEPTDIASAIRRLLAILASGGTLYLTWRVSAGGDSRDKHGRLYASFDPALVLNELTAATEVLLDEQAGSASSGKLVRRIVARKSD
jgi:SAM-dependent methyltransferase